MPRTQMQERSYPEDAPARTRVRSRSPSSVKPSRFRRPFSPPSAVNRETNVKPRLPHISLMGRKSGHGVPGNLVGSCKSRSLIHCSKDSKLAESVRHDHESGPGHQALDNMPPQSRTEASAASYAVLPSMLKRHGPCTPRRTSMDSKYALPISAYQRSSKIKESRSVGGKDFEHGHASTSLFGMESLQNRTRVSPHFAIHGTKTNDNFFEPSTISPPSRESSNMSMQHRSDPLKSTGSSVLTSASPFSLQSAPSSITSHTSSISPVPDVKHQQVRRVPSELAHLDVAMSTLSTPIRRIPPPRPSRVGAPDLWQSCDSPQSEFDSMRAASCDDTTRDSGLRCSVIFRHESSKLLSDSTGCDSTRQGLPRLASEPPESLNSSEAYGTGRNEFSMVSADHSPRTPAQLGFFPFESKNKPSSPGMAKSLHRKGPAAGTGHEGYAKIRFRPRSRNVHSSNYERATSVDSAGDHILRSSGSANSMGGTKSSIYHSRVAKSGSVVHREISSMITMPIQNADSTHAGHKHWPSPTSLDLSRIDSSASQGFAPKAKDISEASAFCATDVSQQVPLDSRLTTPDKKAYGDYWLRSSEPRARSPPPSSFAWRLFGGKSSRRSMSGDCSGELETSDRGALEKPIERDARTNRLNRAHISEISMRVQLLVDTDISARSSRGNSTKDGAEPPIVAFDERHEGLMPAMPKIYRTKPSRKDRSMPATAYQDASVDGKSLSELAGIVDVRPQQAKADFPAPSMSSTGQESPTIRDMQNVSEKTSCRIGDAHNLHHDVSFRQMSAAKQIVPLSQRIENLFESPSCNNSDLLSSSSSGSSRDSILNDASLQTEDDRSEYYELCDAGSQDQSPNYGRHDSFRDKGPPTDSPAELIDHDVQLARSMAKGESFGTCEQHLESADAALSDDMEPKVRGGPATIDFQDARSGTPRWFDGPISRNGEFRHAAMVTSKWLYFGRILFSPVHEEAKSGINARVLMIDGLGTEWSYYCALNYPACHFYHLGPEVSTPVNDAVPNYHHIPHTALSSAIPFSQGFFSGAVLRFPKVSSDESYASCVSEIKRILRPGGYMEISTIDLDLVKMGSRARKAVKDLKLRLHQHNDHLSLWNQGDRFLTLLGRSNFVGVQSCVVALPAAGTAPSSGEVADALREEDLQDSHRPSCQDIYRYSQGPGLIDMLRNRNHNSALDEQITNTVARVGRWWYSTCYEETISGLDNSAHNSIWQTPGLMRDMGQDGTSLKLLICFAQKPYSVKRRTASV